MSNADVAVGVVMLLWLSYAIVALKHDAIARWWVSLFDVPVSITQQGRLHAGSCDDCSAGRLLGCMTGYVYNRWTGDLRHLVVDGVTGDKHKYMEQEGRIIRRRVKG